MELAFRTSSSAPAPDTSDSAVEVAGKRPPLHRRVVAVAREVIKGLFAHHAFDHAATMAFYFFLGSIPLFVVFGLLVGSVVQREGAEALASPLLRVLPQAASDLLRNELVAIAETDVRSVAPVSVAGFVWLTTNGIHNVMDVFELLVDASPRPWWRQRLIATVWVLAAIAVMAAATWLVLVVDDAAVGIQAVRHLPLLLGRASRFVAHGWQRLGVLVLFIALTGAALATFYRTAVVYPPNVRRRVWPGTIVALLSWALVSWAFGAYVATIAHYAVYYGSLATIAVILLWLYLTSLALLVGAELNAHLEKTRA